MWEMKTDMAGAGAVLYAMQAIARKKPSVRVTGILCLAENLIDANAYRPGDIFVAKNGKSVHIANTDAEGRLILTDGLHRAGEEGATHILDIATLTGACIVALGNSINGLFANDAGFRDLLQKAAHETGELYWELPLHGEYRDSLKTPYADINNAGSRDGGAIQAALFLKEFVPDKTKWIHLDIAGPAFTAKPWKYFAEGATAMGLRTMVNLAEGLH
jgi:leucyl aminopeptidase